MLIISHLSILKFHATMTIQLIFYIPLQHQHTIQHLLTKTFNEILGHFRRNTPYGQMIEPKGKGGLISTSNYIGFLD